MISGERSAEEGSRIFQKNAVKLVIKREKKFQLRNKKFN